MDNTTSININKYISSTGICSRREAEKFIEQGLVKINGETAVLGNRVREGDEVTLKGDALQPKAKPVYIALNKPVGIVCTTDGKESKNIVRYLNYGQRLFPIGRLDKPSEGLIFLTNDGDIVNKILRAGNNHQKEYIVDVDQDIDEDFVRRMSEGLPILGTMTKKCRVEKLGKRSFKIVLTEGLNRQIRRMTSYLGYEVTRLQRSRIMNVSLEGIKYGEWRELTSDEVSGLMTLVASSSKTEEASLPNKKAKSFKPKKRRRS
jgi:23S rRNA pseudouridine2604 synthase